MGDSHTKTSDLSRELDLVLPLSLAKISYIHLILENVSLPSFGEIFFTSELFSFFT